MTAQFYKHDNKDFLAIDTDQINASFHSFKKLNVKKLAIMSDSKINARGWDTLIELIYNSKSDIIVDNGAS